MKTKYLLCVLAISGLLLCAASARAELLFSYDFNALNDGTIVNQDGWVSTMNVNRYDAHVGDGIGVNTSKVFMSSPDTFTGSAKISDARRLHATPLVFTTADTEAEFCFWGNTERGEGDWKFGNLAVSMRWDNVSNEFNGSVGLFYSTGTQANPQTYFRNYKATATKGDTLVAGHWYEIKTVMDLSQLCDDDTTYGQVTLYYRDATESETEFTKDGTIQDMDMYLPLDTGEQFISNGIHAYVQVYSNYVQHQYVDNISITRIPEPSTLALLAIGLVGLLAYGWKKRK